MRILTDVMKSNNYAAEPMLQSCGVKIISRFTQVEGRVLSAPRLKVGNGDDVIPRNSRWNFNRQVLDVSVYHAYYQLGGLNSLLAIEQSRNLPVVSKVPTITFGMDVLHASPGQSGIPSIAVVVSNQLKKVMME
ncbi:hypothetical protein K2173_013372 [Erythroxylum novogranatense]|uniref:Argonaute linker 2 domain-containing protein n=1 Tax=Erythroxylum novogranatense TaxID=1862640 RepID=A0AAV8S4E8_9ROSI|nr:hypothetical protein K2173_013372 [Erythroxylum novogranatense]